MFRKRLLRSGIIIIICSIAYGVLIQYTMGHIISIQDNIYIFNRNSNLADFVSLNKRLDKLILKSQLSYLENKELVEQLDEICIINNDADYVHYALYTTGKVFSDIAQEKVPKITMEDLKKEDNFFLGEEAYDLFPIRYSLLEDSSGRYLVVFSDVPYFLSKETKESLIFYGISVSALIILIFFLLYHFYRSLNTSIGQVRKSINKATTDNLHLAVTDIPSDEIGSLLQEFNDMKRRVQNSIERERAYEENRRYLISGLSHDIKTPITTVKGYLEGIIDGVATTEEKRHRYLEITYEQVLYMEELVNDLFLYSRLNLGEELFSMTTIDYTDFFNDLIDEVEEEISQLDGILLKQTVKKSFFGKGDPMKLRRVFRNIINNSIKYNNQDQLVLNMTLEEQPKSLRFIISDNGPGIPMEKADNIFGRFTRLDVSRNITNGTGLGLSICKEIVEHHGGAIRVIPTVIGGLSIEVVLPKEVGHETNPNY